MSHINNAAGGGSPTPGTIVLNYTYVDAAMSPYTVLPTDDFIGADSSTGEIFILLTNAPQVGRTYIVKDIGNDAQANNIFVSTVSGLDLIDGSITTTMNTNLESLQFLYAGGSRYYIY